MIEERKEESIMAAKLLCPACRRVLRESGDDMKVSECVYVFAHQRCICGSCGHQGTVAEFDDYSLESEKPERTAGQVGYEAYALHTGGKTFDGRPMPTWEEVRASGTKVEGAWEAAAVAILGSRATSLLLTQIDGAVVKK